MFLIGEKKKFPWNLVSHLSEFVSLIESPTGTGDHLSREAAGVYRQDSCFSPRVLPSLERLCPVCVT